MIKGIYCKKKEEVVSINECIECSKVNFECHIFTEYLNWLNSDDEDYSKDITVTKLLYCPRRSYFYSKLDYIISPEDAYALFRGSIIHSFLEKYSVADCIVETKFSKKYKNIEIYGTPDKIDIKNKIIYDFKTIAGKINDDYSLRWGNPHLEHIVQLNLYKWLLEDRFEIEKLCLVYIGSDCSRKIIVEERKQNDKKKYKAIQKAFERAEILSKVWDKEYLNLTSKDLPKEEGWLCSYCAFGKECNELDKK